MTKKFTKAIANEIANNSLCGVLEDILYASRGDYYYTSLSIDAQHFEDNFVEDLEQKGFIVTEYRINIINECFNKRLKVIKDKFEKIYLNEVNRYKKKKDEQRKD